MTIVDTTFLVDILRGEAKARHVAEAHRAEAWPLHTTIVSFFEMHRGLAMVDWPPDQLRKIKQALRGMPILPLGQEAAILGGQLDGSLRHQGQAIQPEDAMIAGISLHHGLAVLTRNTRHFERITGLQIQTY